MEKDHAKSCCWLLVIIGMIERIDSEDRKIGVIDSEDFHFNVFTIHYELSYTVKKKAVNIQKKVLLQHKNITGQLLRAPIKQTNIYLHKFGDKY